jgi:replicative DNA helicase
MKIAAGVLKPEDFYFNNHRIIFMVMTDMHRNGEPCDIVTVTERLKELGKLDSCGGTIYFTTLISQVPTAAGIGQYAGIVRAKAYQRELIRTADRLMEQAYSDDVDFGEMLTAFSRSLDAMRERELAGQVLPVRADEAMVEELKAMENRAKSETDDEGICTNLQSVNTKMNNIQRGDFVIVAGRTSVGKSAFLAHNLAIPAALHGKSILYLSCEMSSEAIVRRMIVAYSSTLQSFMLRKRSTLRDRWDGEGGIEEDMAMTIEQLWGIPLWVAYKPGLTPAQVIAYAEYVKSRNNGVLDAVIVDHLHRMSPDTKTDNMRMQIMDVSKTTHNALANMGVACIFGAQLSRKPKDAKDHHPVLEDLKESGSLEQDADIVLFLHRECLYNDSIPENEAEIMIAKQRDGEIGRVQAYFDGPRVRFYEKETA